MKRLIIGCQIAVITLFALKLLFLANTAENPSFFPAFLRMQPDHAVAQTTRTTQDRSVRDITDDVFMKERDLFALLQKKQRELEERENAVKAQEQKIADLQAEIMQKMDALKQMRAQLSPLLDDERENEAKRLRDLAKVYEAAPPEKAAAAMEKLGVETAAFLTINMRRERAGLILGHLSPQKAVDITNEITKSLRIAEK